MVFSTSKNIGNVLHISFTGEYDTYNDSLHYINIIKQKYNDHKSFDCVFDTTMLSNLSYSVIKDMINIFKRHIDVFKEIEGLSKTYMRNLVIIVSSNIVKMFVNILLQIKQPVVPWKVCSDINSTLFYLRNTS